MVYASWWNATDYIHCHFLLWGLSKITKSKSLMMNIYTFILFLLNIAVSLPVRFSVIGPDLPLVIPPGEDAVLPCHLSPQINAENMTIRWFKGKYHNLVHLYQRREHQYESPMAEYRSRTTFIKDGIKAGSVSLIIHNVRQFDSGLYTCFYDTGYFYEEAVVELVVAALGSKPHIYVEDLQNEGIIIVCESSGWYPEPEAKWKDDNGNNISSSTSVKAVDDSLQFHIKATYVFGGHPNTLSCCIRSPILSQWKESTLHIRDAFIQRISSCILSRLLIAASFTVLGILLLSWTVYLVNEQRRLSGNLDDLQKEIDWRQARRFAGVILFTVDNQGVIRAGRPPAAYNDDFTSRARVLGKLCDVSHVLFSPEGLLYVVKGSEIYRGPMPSGPSKNWLQDTAKCVGKTDWGRFKYLFFHPKGALYATTHEGELYTGPPPANEDQSWLYTQATKVGNNGWDSFNALFFDTQGVLHAVSKDKFFKRSPPTSAAEIWIIKCQTIGRGSEWSGLSHFMSFTPDGNLWCVSKSDGRIYTASPPTGENDNWLGRAENLGPSYLFKFIAFTREVEQRKSQTFPNLVA